MNTLDFPTSPSARTTRHYTERQKLHALNLLACCNGNLREAARTADIPWTTLRSWSQQYSDQYAAYCNTVRGDANTVDRVELPELGGLLTDLEAKADLLIATITPERLADIPLTHVARLLTSILPRIESMRKVAAAREYTRARSKNYRDIVYIVQRLVPDPILQQQIHDEFARLNSPQLLEPAEDENDNPEPAPTTNATATPSAVSEQTDTQELASESPLSQESIREMDDSDEGGGVGVGETAAQRENAISEMSASKTCCVSERTSYANHQTHPDRIYRHPLPYSEERATGKGALPHTCGTGGLGAPQAPNERANAMSEMSERGISSPDPEGRLAEGPRDRPFTAGTPNPHRPPTLEELHNVPIHTTWAGG